MNQKDAEQVRILQQRVATLERENMMLLQMYDNMNRAITAITEVCKIHFGEITVRNTTTKKEEVH